MLTLINEKEFFGAKYSIHYCFKIYIQCILFYQSELKIIERQWHVETDYKSRSSVITLVHIVPDKNFYLQKDKNLSPASWWSPCISEEEIEAIINDLTIKHSQFSQYWYHWVTITQIEQTKNFIIITSIINIIIIKHIYHHHHLRLQLSYNALYIPLL